ncbi:sterol desaturase family protein [Paucidesulfovibrio longus]|uniref:sterol desaturase family protein n=1 Tax=Paucidesulfovibrio longus TaxID=889 RepID=UPI0003B697D5|nr:sterol desaturase family protein [Paucidesulfovibrio longus]
MQNEVWIRLGAFFGVFVLMSALEAAFPRRPRKLPRLRRWPGNLGMVASAALLARLLLPMAPVGAALWSAQQGVGLFHALPLPPLVEGVMAVLFLDAAIYWQHRAFHRFRPLWRVHRMHHSDLDLDASSGLRFHPIELLASLIFKMLLVVLLGASAVSVLVFELLLNGCAMFNHANLALPPRADRLLRLLLITPDMHRVHHSTDMRESNRNFGFSVPWWDRIFATYKPHPDKGQLGMEIGLNIFRSPSFSRIDRLLLLPFL